MAWMIPGGLEDHPRGCGEHRAGRTRAVRTGGSSPRMRGARATVCKKGHRRGIIPADAGSTRLPCVLALESEDHPRGCGEHVSVLLLAGFGGGSSPRMRGAQGIVVVTDRNGGIIPADAGSTGNEGKRPAGK